MSFTDEEKRELVSKTRRETMDEAWKELGRMSVLVSKVEILKQFKDEELLKELAKRKGSLNKALLDVMKEMCNEE